MKYLTFEEIMNHKNIYIEAETKEDANDLILKYVEYKKHSAHLSLYDNSEAWEKRLPVYKPILFWIDDIKNIYETERNLHTQGVNHYVYKSNPYIVSLI